MRTCRETEQQGRLITINMNNEITEQGWPTVVLCNMIDALPGFYALR